MTGNKTKYQILLVDDEENILDGYRRTLRKARSSWKLFFSNGVGDAIEKLKEHEIDIVLSDVSMRGRNGFDLLSYIKNDDKLKDISFVIVTGLNESKMKTRALDMGADDLLSKPVESSELISRINSLLKLKKYKDELKKRNSELEKQITRIQRIELTGMLAAGCVHDLRNLLGAIHGLAELVHDETQTDKMLISNIMQSTDLAAELTEQILSFARDDHSKEQLSDILKIAHKCVEIVRKTIPLTIDLNLHYDNTKNYVVIGNPTEMYQVIMNLLINASQAIGKNGSIDLHLNIGYSNNGNDPDGQEDPTGLSESGSVEVMVEDTGCGIPEDVIDKIFDPLYTTKTEKKGTGLGLSVVRDIVGKNGGVITVDSVVNEGTKIKLMLRQCEEVPCSAAP